MTPTRDSRAQSIFDTLASMARERTSVETSDFAEKFVVQYFAGTAVDDLLSVDVSNLYGAAMTHLTFARDRLPGTAKVHVYNPQFQQHGWQSTHTIVEIVMDDMPFLVDSVRMALNQRGLTTHLIVHPVVRLKRAPDGSLIDVLLPDDKDCSAVITEAVMHCEVDRQTETPILEAIRDDVEKALGDVAVAVEDWADMRLKLGEVIDSLRERPPPIDVNQLAEGIEFLKWMDNNHFTFLGYREYVLSSEAGQDELWSTASSGLGLLRNPLGASVSHGFATLSEEKRREARIPDLLVITKGNHRSTVHRPTYMDYVGIKQINAEGEVTGEHRFLGLYTSAAYNRNPRSIPLLRTKVKRIVEQAGYPSNSHAEKTLLNVLDTYPRDELFQVSDDEMLVTALGILHLQERQRIRLFVHRDRFNRFVSCIVFVPRERFNTDIRLQIQRVLEESFNGLSTDFTVQLSESVLARLYFVIRVGGTIPAVVDERQIEHRLKEVTRSWHQDLNQALLDQFGEERGSQLSRRYVNAFRADYREYYSPLVAVYDIEIMETLVDDGSIAMSLYRPLDASAGELQFKLFRYKQPISLSEALPMLENMGLTVHAERPSTLSPASGEPIWMHDFTMLHKEGSSLVIDEIRTNFQDAFEKIWFGDVENDGFNRLVLGAALTWREIVIMRACCKYLRLTNLTFSQEYMEDTLAKNTDLARLLVKLFHARFVPSVADDKEALSIVRQIYGGLDSVVNLDEDRIIRSFLELELAMVRTNFYQINEEGEAKTHVSFKFDPIKVPDLPKPRPMCEIFVYSPRVEGVHLRGGPVARGGLRWSVRREDFRTEVLSLAKAQTVKNAVIVPVGSKGGFVSKRLADFTTPEEVMSEGIASYQTYIRGLLDVTDNLRGSEIVPPTNLKRYDSDDPYLVVAADKGTATFSDYANDIATQYGYWLGDAFASGGSTGYDHKAMAITARGAWESVKRHFREMDLNTQSVEFTVMGIGDMGGDVFGNAMLLSQKIQLIGAFNHQHIFLDPSPDPMKSFEERKRLSEMSDSSWAAYDWSYISEGGGVFSRAAKSIELTPQVQTLLGVSDSAMTPNELICSLLKVKVDLLWNGGIGTYVKASHEQHIDVGDRANDVVRINARELRCRVVGEGGNLGLTQLARVEFALEGGRIFTDAIDNSGGVDCSDHEVNIKILLNAPVVAGDMTTKQRNFLLEEMTDEVAALVLRNNYLQTQALSCAAAHAPSMLEIHERLIDTLERERKLDRSIEFLPDKASIAERRTKKIGLTTPELAVLLAYTKIELFKELLDSDLPRDDFFVNELGTYFPTPLRERFANYMPSHRLAHEIVSTVVANNVVNRAGITFCFRLREETGVSASNIARVFAIAQEIFQLNEFWTSVEGLDYQVASKYQTQMVLQSRRLIERSARWLLKQLSYPINVNGEIARFGPGATELEQALNSYSGTAVRCTRERNRLIDAGVPESIADRVSKFPDLYSVLDIVDVAVAVNRSVTEVGAVYFQLSEALGLPWLRDTISALPRGDRWQVVARAGLRDDLYVQEAALTREVLGNADADMTPEAAIADWLKRNRSEVTHSKKILLDLKASSNTNFAMVSVAMQEIRSLRKD